MEVKTATYEFWGDTIQLITPIIHATEEQDDFRKLLWSGELVVQERKKKKKRKGGRKERKKGSKEEKVRKKRPKS